MSFYSPHISEQSGKTQQAGNENKYKKVRSVVVLSCNWTVRETFSREQSMHKQFLVLVYIKFLNVFIH